MSQGSIIMVLGLITAIAPFLGIPLSWLEILLPLVGLTVVVFGYLSNKKTDSHVTREDTPVTA